MGLDNGKVIFKNLTIQDDSVSYAEGSWEFGYLEFRGDLEFDNCTFVSAVMMSGTNAKFTGCEFNSNKDNEYAVWVDHGDATFTDCLFKGPRGIKVHEAYGSDVGNVVVDGCTFDGLTKKPGVVIGCIDRIHHGESCDFCKAAVSNQTPTAITVEDSNFMNCQPGDQSKYIYESDTDISTFTFKLEDNTVMVSKELTVSPLELDFETAEAGYSGITPKTVTIKNGDSSRPVKVDLPASSDYELSAVTGDLDANGYIIANGTATFTVKPKDGLGAGNHDENLLLSLTVSPGESPAVNVVRVEAKFNVTAPTSKPSSGSGISVKYNGGNSFSTSKSDVPTSVEIDGVEVPFTGNGKNFSVGCISSDAKWVTVRWNSTSVTTNFTPDGLVECTTVSIPKTGDMSIWAAIAQFLGF